MAEQMQPMPDVPERCPLCGSETLYTGVNLYHACGTRSTPGGEVVTEGLECTVRQRDAARAEAERLKTENERLRREREAALDILSRKDIGEGAKLEGVRLILKGGDGA